MLLIVIWLCNRKKLLLLLLLLFVFLIVRSKSDSCPPPKKKQNGILVHFICFFAFNETFLTYFFIFIFLKSSYPPPPHSLFGLWNFINGSGLHKEKKNFVFLVSFIFSNKLNFLFSSPFWLKMSGEKLNNLLIHPIALCLLIIQVLVVQNAKMSWSEHACVLLTYMSPHSVQ